MHTSAFDELIDIFPTLTELAGLDCHECALRVIRSPLCVSKEQVLLLFSQIQINCEKKLFSQYPRPAEGITLIPMKHLMINLSILRTLWGSLLEWISIASQSGIGSIAQLQPLTSLTLILWNRAL